MTKLAKVKDPKHITVVLSGEQYDWLQKMCWRMTAAEKRTIGVSEAVRRAIETCYPVPKSDQLEIGI